MWPWRKPEKRALSFQDVFGQGADIPQVNGASIDNALRLVAVYAAVRLLANTVASLPLQVYRKVGDVRQQIPTPSLLTDPSPNGTAHEWIQRIMMSLTLRGNAYGYVTTFDADGNPRTIEWLHPDDVSINDNRVQVPTRWYWMGRPIELDRMVHIPGEVLPGLKLGLSPIAAYALTVETGLLSQQFGRDWFRNGVVPAAVLETDQKVTNEDAQILKARFKAAAAGRDVVALGLGTKYRPISVAPEESQFLATIKATVNQIASIYGIPAERIGGESSSSRTYANREQDALDFVTYSLGPYLAKLEAHLSTLLPRGQYVKFNVDALLRADLKTRYEAHHLALSDGWKSRDEIRALEDLPPLPNGRGGFDKPAASAPAEPGRVRPLRPAAGQD